MSHATRIELHKYGRNYEIDSGTPETIWAAGGDYVWATAAEKVSVVSDNTADTANGTGLRTVRVEGLDANYDLQNEVLILNGTTPVIGSLDFIRVFRQRGVLAGSIGANVGIITFKGVTSDNTYGAMVALSGNSQLGFYTVARNGFLELSRIFCTCAKVQPAGAWEVRVMIREFERCWNLFATLGSHTYAGPVERVFVPTGLPISAKSDIELIGASTANDTNITAEFDGVLSIAEVPTDS